MTADRRNDDDADWLAALAGRPGGDIDPATRAEAALLRAATRADPPPTAAGAALDIEALLAQARAEARARPAWCAGCAARLQGWRDAFRRHRWAGGGLGLGLAGLLLVLTMGRLGPPGGPPPDAGSQVLRGADGVWLLRDAAPAARRERIAAVLQAAGVAVTRYERLGRAGLDASLPVPTPPGLRDRLRADGLRPDDDGTLRVEIEPAQP